MVSVGGVVVAMGAGGTCSAGCWAVVVEGGVLGLRGGGGGSGGVVVDMSGLKRYVTGGRGVPEDAAVRRRVRVDIKSEAFRERGRNRAGERGR